MRTWLYMLVIGYLRSGEMEREEEVVAGMERRDVATAGTYNTLISGMPDCRIAEDRICGM